MKVGFLSNGALLLGSLPIRILTPSGQGIEKSELIAGSLMEVKI